MPKRVRKPPTSDHFKFERIADGVFAAIAVPGGGGFGNAGIIDLGDHTVIFDTGETPMAADDLKNAAEDLTGRQVTYVINSHAHPDHWFGNQVFADHAAIIATHNAREHMLFFLEDWREVQEEPSELEEMLRHDKEFLKNVIDARQRKALQHAIGRMENTLQALPVLDPKLPTLTFDGKLVFYGSQRRADLVTRGVGHTSGDCFLILPEEKIVFLGDLAFFQREPFMRDCDPQAWVAQLEELEGSAFESFVPGHGPVGTKADVTLEKDYIIILEALVTGSVKGGEPVEKALERPLPPPFDAWSLNGTPSEPNVHFLYERLQGRHRT